MLFNEKIDESEIDDLSMVNFLNITNKAYTLYLNQQIEDFDLDMEQAAFIAELNKNQTISTKDLAEYLFINGRQSGKTLMTLYSRGIIDKKSNKETENTENTESSENTGNTGNTKSAGGTGNTIGADNSENINNSNDQNDMRFDLENELNQNRNIEIVLTSYGEKLASKIKKIDENWENLIYKNLESSDKDEILKNIKDLAITSVKTNEIENISSNEAKISKTKKMMSKMLNHMFDHDFHGKKSNCGDKSFDKRRHFHGMKRHHGKDSMDPFMFEAHFRGSGFPHRRGPFFR